MPPRTPTGTSGSSSNTSTAIDSTLKPTSGPTLKNLLKSADILLKPPTPLSSNPTDLIQRLKACSKSLPKEWRKVTPEWCNEDEQERPGDQNQNEQDEELRKRRRDELVFVVGKRCFALIKSIQLILEKEFWPKETRGIGMDERDFLLGTADLRLIRLMLSHTTFSYLLPLASHYAESLPTFLPKTAESLSVTLESLLKLLKTTVPPTPDAGPSSRAPTPPTTITQTLLSSHLIPIFLSTLIIAYTPSKPSETYANLRSEFIKALMSLSPGHAISTLVNVLKLLVQGSKEGVKSNGWVRVWPKYPKEIINGLLTAQVRRPGGVRGLMENVLGETAKTDDVTSIEGQRLDHIFNVLIRIPRQVTPEIYYPWLLSELFAMIPLTSHSHLPVAYVNTACYCIQRLWASNRPLIGDWLKNKLHSPWYPKLPNSLPQNNDKIVVTSWEAIQRSVQNMRLLLLHNPSSHEFADFLVGSILPPLFSLHTFLNRHQDHLLVKVKKGSDVEINLEEGVQSLLVSWGKAVDEVAGVKGIWSIAESGRGWGGKESIEGDGVDLHWEKEGEGVKLVVSRDKAKTSQDDITLPSISSMQSSNEDSLAQFLARQIISPDPQLLCQLIESLDRPDIASEVILKALDSWRIKLATEIEPSLESLSNLQLTIQMMEKLGSQLFTRPSQVLGFVERVLHDQVQSLDGGDEKAEVEDEKPFIEEVNDGHAGDKGLNDDVAPDGKRGLIEVACQLLASLEGEGQLKEDLPILQPILSHLNVLSHRSPSVSIRNAAREAQLLLSQQHFPDHDPLVGPQQASRETYQKAITLIKDDTLPVKAHGLTMLKDLVFSVGFDTALVPNILGIYLEQLDDKDSFIYLSAIKGLSGMVDALGKDVFVPLIGKYTGEIEALERNEKKGDEGTIERVLRLAEAIDQVAERTGDALGGYANEIVPPLMSIYPLSSLPTVIRSSALSILSTCARVSPFTILPWANDLAQGTLDLIQVESVVSSPFKSDNIQPQPQPQEEERNPQMQWGKSEFVQLVDDDPLPTHEESTPSSEKPSNPRIVDEEPTLKEDGKHPTLRRAALSVFNWCVRVVLFVRFMDTAQSQDHEEQSDIKLQVPLKESIKITPLSNEGEREDQVFSDQFVQRALDILGYVQMRDDDEVVRQHAESALRDLKLLRNRGVEFEDGGLGLEGLKGLESLRIA
ncbi:hypothetical protein I302_105612 [Kwoniella bestiolae CBS 10118]|uniref:RNA polymerase II assembly factor Rtp1 C-terminal domain-containing protein n=1 Tax=Kwoniella bestiolae CBS 10118 TaxID=1296100 RepID=A0AAJ8M9T5_9TREE